MHMLMPRPIEDAYVNICVRGLDLANCCVISTRLRALRVMSKPFVAANPPSFMVLFEERSTWLASLWQPLEPGRPRPIKSGS